jgi:hypothetical protein
VSIRLRGVIGIRIRGESSTSVVQPENQHERR